jgi:hypothetical protein
MELTPEVQSPGAIEPQATIVLRPSRARWLAAFAACLVFAAIGVMMIRDGAVSGWLVAGGFGVAALACAVVLLPGSAYLKVRRDGFVFGTLFRRWYLPWTAVGPFSVAIVGRDEIVVFDIIDAARMPRMPGLPGMPAGANAGLPDTYGLTAGELAAVLNTARDKSLARANAAG